jgi:hypothetical protein
VFFFLYHRVDKEEYINKWNTENNWCSVVSPHLGDTREICARFWEWNMSKNSGGAIVPYTIFAFLEGIPT